MRVDGDGFAGFKRGDLNSFTGWQPDCPSQHAGVRALPSAYYRNVVLSLPTVDSMHFPMKFLLFVLLLVPLVAIADQDADFLAARDAFRAGNVVRFDRIAARMKNSPLEPYLAYYRLRLQLETVNETAIHTFLSRPDDTPVIDRLRGEWLHRPSWSAVITKE